MCYEEKFRYDISEKDKCWYSAICDKSRCGDNFCIRHYKMESLTYLALMSGKLKYSIPLKPDEVDLPAFRRLKEIKDGIDDFVKEGRNLLIFSKNTGVGKTEFAKKLLLSWFDKIWATTDFECRGLFVSLPKLMSSMKENISKENDYFQYVQSVIELADLVVWDEMNYKDLTTFEHDYLLNIIGGRIAVGKANIFTSNYTLDQIEQKLGSRLSSRIIGCSECIELKGSDKRGLNR